MYVPSRWERLRDALTSPQNRSVLVGTVLLLGVVLLGIRACPSFPDDPGTLAPPEQTETERTPFEHDGWMIHPRAEYDVTGVVVSTHRYWFDASAPLSRWDVAVAWGRSAHGDVLGAMRFTHHTRFLHWNARDELPVSWERIEREIANIHTIAPDRAHRRTIGALRPGELVRLRGALVDVRGPNGFVWNTSLTRDDTGNGACELLWVDSIERLP